MGIIKRILYCICGSIVLFFLGYLFGMHHRLIAAMVRGETPPEAPKECPFG